MAAVLSGTLVKSSKNHGAPRYFIAAAKFSTTEKKSKTAEASKNPLFDPKLASLKRGTGGRSSFNGVIASVFGASGLVGARVVNKLGKEGTQIILPYRGDYYDIRTQKLAGDLGQMLFFPYHLKDEESIRKSMCRSNVVINCIGREYETKNFTLEDVHIAGARRIARIARECGVKRLIHFSALNANPKPKPMVQTGGSKFYKTKYYGELAVKEEFPDVTIFRPSDIWGAGDRFIHYYCHGWRRTFGKIPLWQYGEFTEKQPVYASDVALAVVHALKDPETMGKTYDLVGPNRYKLGDLIDWIFRCMRRGPEYKNYKRTDLQWDFLMRLRITLTELLPSEPIKHLCWNRVEREVTSDLLTGNPTLEDLGITPTSLESRIMWETVQFRAFNYYNDEVGEFPPAVPPKYVVPSDD